MNQPILGYVGKRFYLSNALEYSFHDPSPPPIRTSKPGYGFGFVLGGLERRKIFDETKAWGNLLGMIVSVRSSAEDISLGWMRHWAGVCGE